MFQPLFHRAGAGTPAFDCNVECAMVCEVAQMRRRTDEVYYLGAGDMISNGACSYMHVKSSSRCNGSQLPMIFMFESGGPFRVLVDLPTEGNL